MNSFLLNRQLGSISPQSLARPQKEQLLKSLQPADNVEFALQPVQGAASAAARTKELAHPNGVNSIAIDRQKGRYLLSGGADSSVALWDLETPTDGDTNAVRYLPIKRSKRTSKTGLLGITHITWFPFDSNAFLTSGYDHYLKFFSLKTFEAKVTFDMDAIVYSHAMSNVAGGHVLVACACQNPLVRLVDLRSRANTHSLAGHSGSVLSVAWHPREENILASGATDGVVRLWDVRRGAASLGVLDLEDSYGITGYIGLGSGARGRERGRAHRGAVNGIAWTEDGRYLVSTAHDEKMRVWNVTKGANTLANFGPNLKNAATTNLFPLIVPSRVSALGHDTILYPNPREILAFDMHSGALRSRLRVPGLQSADASIRNPKNRTTSLAWRAHDVELYSAHGDGTIRCWKPRTWEDDVADQDSVLEDGKSEDRKRKREAFDQIVQDLTKKKITFS